MTPVSAPSRGVGIGVPVVQLLGGSWPCASRTENESAAHKAARGVRFMIGSCHKLSKKRNTLFILLIKLSLRASDAKVPLDPHHRQAFTGSARAPLLDPKGPREARQGCARDAAEDGRIGRACRFPHRYPCQGNDSTGEGGRGIS